MRQSCVFLVNIFRGGNAAFKATCYSVVCQPIYIGLDSAFTSQATGTRPEEHRDSHDRNVINLWPRLIFAKSSPSLLYTVALQLARACLPSDRVGSRWIIPLNTRSPANLFFFLHPFFFTPNIRHCHTSRRMFVIG